MFVIELIYKADLAEIDATMAAHVAFLNKYYASGNFLISGRKVPREGGIVLAAGKTRPQIQAIVEEDPFVARGLADFRLIEFRASRAQTTSRRESIAERVDQSAREERAQIDLSRAMGRSMTKKPVFTEVNALPLDEEIVGHHVPIGWGVPSPI